MTWDDRPRQPFGDLSAIVAGQGPDLVLLHGVGLRAEAWGAQIDALAHRYRVVAPDMPGHGDSAPFAGPVGLGDYTDRVAAALSGPALVAGHSMGAMIALDLAIRHPGSVRAVAALNAVYRRSAEASAAVRARAASLGESSDNGPTIFRWFSDGDSPAARACRRWLDGVDRAGYAAAYRVFAAEDGPPEPGLRSLSVPAFFMTGAQEPNSTPAMTRAMAAAAPRGRALVIDGAMHMMPMTHADDVNAALDSFFSEVPT